MNNRSSSSGGFHGYRKQQHPPPKPTPTPPPLSTNATDHHHLNGVPSNNNNNGNNMNGNNNDHHPHQDTNSNNNNNNNNNECTVREQDRFMPIANVIRIMRKILPPHAKISDDAKETIQECVSEYISFITGEANERCQREQRKTITAEDVLWAMSKLGFDDYIEPLTLYLHRYRELEGDRGSIRTCEPLLKMGRMDHYATTPFGQPVFHIGPPPHHPGGPYYYGHPSSSVNGYIQNNKDSANSAVCCNSDAAAPTTTATTTAALSSFEPYVAQHK